MIDNGYAARFSRLPTEELMRIADPSGSDEFEGEAIDAAKRELRSRDIDETTTQDISVQIVEEKKAEAGKADLPLSNWAWVGFVLIAPLLLVSLALVAGLYGLGYKRKAKDALSAFLASFVLLAIVSLLFSILG